MTGERFPNTGNEDYIVPIIESLIPQDRGPNGAGTYVGVGRFTFMMHVVVSVILLGKAQEQVTEESKEENKGLLYLVIADCDPNVIFFWRIIGEVLDKARKATNRLTLENFFDLIKIIIGHPLKNQGLNPQVVTEEIMDLDKCINKLKDFRENKDDIKSVIRDKTSKLGVEEVRIEPEHIIGLLALGFSTVRRMVPVFMLENKGIINWADQTIRPKLSDLVQGCEAKGAGLREIYLSNMFLQHIYCQPELFERVLETCAMLSSHGPEPSVHISLGLNWLDSQTISLYSQACLQQLLHEWECLRTKSFAEEENTSLMLPPAAQVMTSFFDNGPPGLHQFFNMVVNNSLGKISLILDVWDLVHNLRAQKLESDESKDEAEGGNNEVGQGLLADQYERIFCSDCDQVHGYTYFPTPSFLTVILNQDQTARLFMQHNTLLELFADRLFVDRTGCIFPAYQQYIAEGHSTDVLLAAKPYVLRRIVDEIDDILNMLKDYSTDAEFEDENYQKGKLLFCVSYALNLISALTDCFSDCLSLSNNLIFLNLRARCETKKQAAMGIEDINYFQQYLNALCLQAKALAPESVASASAAPVLAASASAAPAEVHTLLT